MPANREMSAETLGGGVQLKPGTVVIAADDSKVARSLIEQGLTAMGIPYLMHKTGKEAWEKLLQMSAEQTAGKQLADSVAIGVDRSGKCRRWTGLR